MNPEYESIQELWSRYGIDESISQYLSSSNNLTTYSDPYGTYSMGDMTKLYQTLQSSSIKRGSFLMDIRHFKYDEESNKLTRTIDIRSIMQLPQYSSVEAALDSVIEKSLQITNKETETTVPFEWQTQYKDPLGVEYVAVYTIPGGNYYNYKLAKDGKPLKVEIRYRYTNFI